MSSLLSSFRRLAALAPVALLIVSCRSAAALDAADRCVLDKLRAAGAAASRELLCGNDIDCMRKAAGRARHVLAAADRRAQSQGFACPGNAESLGVAGLAWPLRFRDDYTGTGRERCNAGQLRAASRLTTAYSRCRVESDPDEREDCMHRAGAEFTLAWDSAQSASDCPGRPATEAMAAIVGEIEETASRLEVRCGDGRVGGFEQCDDGGTLAGDGCSRDCRTETCGRTEGEVRCVVCPSDSTPTEGYDGCRCKDGFSGEPGGCIDVDECAAPESPCPAERPCVNLAGTYACAIACTADAFHLALAECGAPSGAIAFNCTDTVIPIAGGLPVYLRESDCNDMTIDGAGRSITFELAPACWQTPLAPEQCPAGLESDGTCRCPDVDSGDVFLQVRGDRNVIRDLTVRGFFEGIPVRGRDNVVENVRFDRLCDDAFGSVFSGVGNVFRHLSVARGCDKCSENGAAMELLDPDPRLLDHWTAKMSDIEFDGCRTPIRIASAGRFDFERMNMHGGEPGFSCDGPRFSSSGEDSRVAVRMADSTVDGCRRGIRFGSGSEAVVEDSRIAGGALRGIRAAGTARVLVQRTTIMGNGGSGSSETGFGGVAVLGGAEVDLGGGSVAIDGSIRQSAGENSICGNRSASGTPLDLETDSPDPVYAMRNWWCASTLPLDRISGSAILDPMLDRAPLAIRP